MMKELDFDELDRAVNTLMSDVPKSVESPSEDDLVQTLTITPSEPSVTTPSIAPEPITEAPVAPVIAAGRMAAAPAARRGGRFMDVVHPSSDMKTASNGLSRTPSRQGVTIDPVDQPPITEPSVRQEDQALNPSESHASPAWPDPLDMVGYHREPDTTSPADQPSDESSLVDDVPSLISTVDTPEPVIEPAVVIDEVSSAEEQPLMTPFLSDAKVIKRPLGTNTSDELDQAPATIATVAEADVPDAVNQLSPTPLEVPVQLPEELQNDLISIESGGDSEFNEPTEVASEQPAPVVAPAETPAGPSSIQQQYKEQPSTGDENNGGIYDTANIHQPLAHPAKKKSGWMWIVWVLILLVLGAAGGAAAYLYLLK